MENSVFIQHTYSFSLFTPSSLSLSLSKLLQSYWFRSRYVSFYIILLNFILCYFLLNPLKFLFLTWALLAYWGGKVQENLKLLATFLFVGALQAVVRLRWAAKFWSFAFSWQQNRVLVLGRASFLSFSEFYLISYWKKSLYKWACFIFSLFVWFFIVSKWFLLFSLAFGVLVSLHFFFFILLSFSILWCKLYKRADSFDHLFSCWERKEEIKMRKWKRKLKMLVSINDI